MALLKRKRSGLADPMSVVTNFVNACNRHDAEGVSACLHPDFDSIQPMYPSRNFRGADQVRRNWQAIFDAEPGFRLTVLRTAAAENTVWLELHGAGREAEVAGVFVMGIQGDRIRWARIYSALVEGSPVVTDDGTVPAPPPLRKVPPLQDDGGADEAVAVAADASADTTSEKEDLIAPVVDIDGNGRSFRRRSRRKGGGEPVVAQDPVLEEAAAALEAEPEPVSDAASDADASRAADSIDPETLVDPERLRNADALPVPGDSDRPAEPADAGSDYDLEKTPAAEAILAPPEMVPESDLMVETMVTAESEVADGAETDTEAEVAGETEAQVGPDEDVSPEPVVEIIEEPVMAGVVEPVLAVVIEPEADATTETEPEPEPAAEAEVEPDPGPKERKGRLWPR